TDHRRIGAVANPNRGANVVEVPFRKITCCGREAPSVPQSGIKRKSDRHAVVEHLNPIVDLHADCVVEGLGIVVDCIGNEVEVHELVDAVIVENDIECGGCDPGDVVAVVSSGVAGGLQINQFGNGGSD